MRMERWDSPGLPAGMKPPRGLRQIAVSAIFEVGSPHPFRWCVAHRRTNLIVKNALKSSAGRHALFTLAYLLCVGYRIYGKDAI